MLYVVASSSGNHTRYSGVALCAGAGRAGFPAAPFGKTPAWAGFGE